MCDRRIELKSEEGGSVKCRVASTFWSRARGFMFQDPPSDGEGLLIKPCNSIHMYFMRFSIDVAFLDGEFRVVKCVRDVAPGKIIGTVRGASQALEIQSGKMPE